MQMSSGHFAGDAFKSGMGLRMAGSALVLSFLFDLGSLLLIFKSNNIFEYMLCPMNIM